MWNIFENKLIKIIDSIEPIVEFKDNYSVNKPCPIIKSKLSLRNRLLKIFKKRPTMELKKRIKNLNIEIKVHFYSQKSNNLRRKIISGSSKSLWDAVNIAFDKGNDTLPNLMYWNGHIISGHERSKSFASFFDCKVKQITDSTVVDPGVYNGARKLFVDCRILMNSELLCRKSNNVS